MRIRDLLPLLLLSATATAAEPKLSFVRDVVPIFTMAGCANSNCHGSIRGQHGFKLSLFGYEPELDFQAITGGDVKRIDREHPDQSLILRKPTFQVAHGGGLRFAVGSLEYRTILEWIEGGATFDSPGSPRIATLTVTPDARLLIGAGATLQLHASAAYTDGTKRDVTRLVQYTSNNPDVVQVSASGEVKALQAGETAIMVRTLGKAAVARIEVAASPTAKDYPAVAPYNAIDKFIFAKLQRLNIRPSGDTSDEEFLRRVYIDTIGMLPTESEARTFFASRDRARRAKTIDALLERPEFADLWALKFTELFRAGTYESGPKGARIVYEWLRRSLLENKPYDKLVTEILLSQGAHFFGKLPSSFYNSSKDNSPADSATNVSQLFLGVRIECARCHNHPWEKWTQDDFYGFAAFFARLGIKEVYENDENANYYMEEGQVTHPKTKQVMKARYLDGGVEEDDPDKDLRAALARWLTSPRNPFFARAIVNRVWKHYMGRGFVEAVDDFRITNPPSHPELLDALAGDLAAHGYDLRRLMRTILNSRTYQLSAEPNDSNRGDAINYSHYYMRRMMAEAMIDTMSEVTGVAEKFKGYPPETRAMQVYSGNPSYMMRAFGRLNREVICERDAQPDIAQTLHLISGDTIQKKIDAWKPEPGLSDAQVVERIFLTSLTRLPRAGEKAAVTQAVRTNRTAAFQDLLWAILNSKEFQYNH